jgi:lambda repressor-like predicted transcriptional regulator
MSASSPLHDAARLLIAEASPETVRVVLRLLLDNVAPAPAPRPVRPLSTAPPRLGRKHAARHAPTSATDPDWETLRQQVRAAMTGQGVDFADLAIATGCSASTMRVSLSRRQPASKRLIAALRAWLAANGERTPEVATPLPFRSRGSERRGNGGGASESVAGTPAGT